MAYTAHAAFARMLRTQVVSLGFECDERHASDPKPSPMHDAGLFSWACLARRECELAGSCGSGVRVVQTPGGLDIVAMATLYPWRRGVNVEERVEGGGAHAAAQRPLHKDRVASPTALLGLVAMPSWRRCQVHAVCPMTWHLFRSLGCVQAQSANKEPCASPGCGRLECKTPSPSCCCEQHAKYTPSPAFGAPEGGLSARVSGAAR